jgi:hypothetical protein
MSGTGGAKDAGLWFDKLTTNGINPLPFILSLSKDLSKNSNNT